MKLMTATFCLLLAASGAWAADSRLPSAKPTKKSVVVVVLDMPRVVRESNLSKTVQADFQAWGEGVKAGLQPKANALQAKQAALQSDGAKLTPERKQAAEKEIADLQGELAQAQQKAQQEYQQRQQAAEVRLRTAFDPVLDAVAKENGWDIILNKADRLVWSSDAVDQTEIVLARFNAAYPAPSAPAPSAPAPSK